MAISHNSQPALPQRLTLLSALFITSFAFLLASFPSRQSSLGRHLATGRELVHEAARTVFAGSHEHAWLFDVAVYTIYTTFGGAGLVLAKALLVAALAALLFSLSQRHAGCWASVFCTVLALLAMSMRLPVAPITVSVCLLALGLWFLWKPEDATTRWSPPWPLVIVFVIWVNIDRWFLIGIATVAFTGFGRAWDLMRTDCAQGRRVMAQTVFWTLALGAACFLNPNHIEAFRAGVRLLGLGSSPFQEAYLTAVGLSPAGLAYFPLLGLSLLSFFLIPSHWSWQRFLPWLALAVMSAVNARAIPFFAVVAGPVLAWNLNDLFRPSPVLNSGILRACAAALALAFLVAAWPGWLSPPTEPRRWAFETPASFERAAATIREWHRDRKLDPGTSSLHISQETADAFAWFCPDDPGRHDRALVAAILGDADDADALDANAPGTQALDAASIDRLIVYHADRARLTAILTRLFSEPDRWALLHVDGGVGIFGRRGPAHTRTIETLSNQAHFEHQAFHPFAAGQAPRIAPEQSPVQWWEAFTHSRATPSFDLEAAQWRLAHAEALRRLAPYRHLTAWDQAHAVALLGLGANAQGTGHLLLFELHLTLVQPDLPKPGFGLESLSDLDQLAHALQQQFTLQRDDAPSALLYLAVRSARRALAENVRNAQAHLVLGESYLRLLKATRERAWARDLPRLVQLRRAQATAALHQALLLKPDLAEAHLSLAGLYRDMKYLDLELTHRRTYLELVRKAGAAPGLTDEQFRAAVTTMEEEVAQLARTAADRTKSFTAQAQGLRVFDRAVLAVQKGLGGKARDILLESDFAAFGDQGMALELELLLKTGRARDVRRWTEPAQRDVLGAPTYHWLRAQAFAALGDYALATDECGKLAAVLRGPEPERTRERMAVLVCGAVLNEQPVGRATAPLLARCWDRMDSQDRIALLARSLRQEAEANVLQGLIALEEGAVDEADVAFRLALSVWKDQGTAAAGGGLNFQGRAVAEDCVNRLK